MHFLRKMRVGMLNSLIGEPLAKDIHHNHYTIFRTHSFFLYLQSIEYADFLVAPPPSIGFPSPPGQ